ncbi:hypothetical protein ASPSYDRAFT_49479 [Aspergillus sydowii CBS 593.65]|uniref:Uncharacterized protein n=1 Tax=Aspergillus sydowii CBS 593.65 TaxID=1036612 RepID=A0A1L9T771_9EURO|nr:uncharacterized protein ASPSYDRAFT_49479 [Aspergillus sydowii CBS 593.65]OJJ55289.1 hypothetical protein ASPSYDRAFT_49479 [Aspergillus sydowii CBS 593.65]
MGDSGLTTRSTASWATSSVSLTHANPTPIPDFTPMELCAWLKVSAAHSLSPVERTHDSITNSPEKSFDFISHNRMEYPNGRKQI